MRSGTLLKDPFDRPKPAGTHHCVRLLCLILLCLASPVMAVDCTPDLIMLSSQAEVDDFQANHGPGCDRVTGQLIIGVTDNSGSDITNLDGLAGLANVASILILDNPLLTDTSGLSDLTTNTGALSIRRNDALTNLNGLSSLAGALGGGLIISNNPLLSDLGALSGITSVGASLEITDNDALQNLDALAGVQSVGWTIFIRQNDALTSISGLAGISGFSAALSLDRNPLLTSLEGLSGFTELRGLSILRNDSLTDLDELAGLTTIGNQFFDCTIRDNASLSSIAGLSDLISVDTGFELSGNPMLADCSALPRLLDGNDDALPGPGPGVAGVPDVNGDVIVAGNHPRCDSIERILEVGEDYGGIFKDEFEAEQAE